MPYFFVRLYLWRFSEFTQRTFFLRKKSFFFFIDVLFENKELKEHSIRKIARDGVELEIEVSEDLQEGDILAETEHYVYAVKIYTPKPPKENLNEEIRIKNYL